MENQVSPEWSAVLIQWALLFAMIGTWFIPAFLFRNLARKYNKKAWPYFLMGPGLGAVVMFFTGYIMRGIQTVAAPYFANPVFDPASAGDRSCV